MRLIAHADTSGKHHHLVVGLDDFVFLMLKGEQAAANEWLPKLVAEVARTIRGFNQKV